MAGAPQRALSDLFLELGEPLMEALGVELRRVGGKGALNLGMMLWNAGVLAVQAPDPGPLERLRAALGDPRIGRGIKATFIHWIDEQRRIAPSDDRIAATVEWRADPPSAGFLRVLHAKFRDLDAAHVAEVVGRQIDACVNSLLLAAAEGDARTDRPRPTGAGRSGARTAILERSEQTAEPVRPPNPWHAPYAEAVAFGKIAPWNWLFDRSVFGVRISGDSATYWCSVMGAGGEFEAIAFYRGAESFALLNMLLAQIDTDEAVYGGDGFLVSFVAKGDLDDAELARARAAGCHPGKNAPWPLIQEMRAGRLPRMLSDQKAERVTRLLRTALPAVEHLRDRRHLGDPAPSRLKPVFEWEGDSLVLDMRKPGSPRRPTFPPVDRVAVVRLKRTLKKVATVAEFDGVPMTIRIADDEGWEFAPAVFMLADAVSGRVSPPAFERPENRFSTCATHLRAALTDSGALPAKLLIRREWIFDALFPTTYELGIELSLVRSLPHLEAARASVEFHSRRH